jgi:TonB family protein
MFTTVAMTGFAIKSIAVLLVAWLITLAMRNRSAASRHLVWLAAAAALLMLPLLSITLPQFAIPGSIPTFSITATASPVADVRKAQNTAKPTATSPQNHRTFTVNWPQLLLVIWAAGVIFGFARMIVGSLAVWRVRRVAKRFGDRALGTELSESLGVTRHVDILESPQGSMPMTFGLWRPAIFMPSDAAHWTEERRRIVLLHELAHVSRGDVAAHIFARIAFTLYWWNPLAWTAWREFLKERERATDDLVLNAGTRASDYAGHLLEVASTMRSGAALGWAAIAMARRSQLEGRVVAILDSHVNRKTAGRASAWVAAAIAIAMVAPLAALRAQDPQSATIPADVDAFIRAANSQKNHEMLERAAKAAEQAQKFDAAQAFLKSAADIHAQVSGAQSAEYAASLLKLGDLERARFNTGSAEDFYSRAVDILGDKPETVRALAYLGDRFVERHDFDKAFNYYERANRLSNGKFLLFMAVVRSVEAKNDEADALFKQAIASHPADSSDTSIAKQIYARFLKKQGRQEEVVQLGLSAGTSPAVQANTPAALPAGVYKIGGAVSQPALIYKQEPGYSELARVVGWMGSVGLSVVVGADGVPQNIQVIKSLGFGLDEKAIEAVRSWRFKPGMKGGEPVPVIANIDVSFRLL